MKSGKECRSSDFELLLDVKSSRVMKLLGELIDMKKIENNSLKVTKRIYNMRLSKYKSKEKK